MHALYNYNDVIIMKNLWNFERPILRLNRYSQFNDIYGIPTMYMQKDSTCTVVANYLPFNKFQASDHKQNKFPC
jgi:hypothetical protein